MGDITVLLQRAGGGERQASNALFEILYPQLRAVARARLGGHVRNAVLDTTVLVHECYLKLLAGQRLKPQDRNHFLAYAARVMRSVIVDTVRASQRERRGGGVLHITLDTALGDATAAGEDEVLDVDASLTQLAALDERLAQVVAMRYFCGMKEAEIAAALGITDRTVRRDWEKARLLLADALRR
ncbi:MAG: sigma-70 family RNA polymerase sigma factor [Rubrivivax sp.]|nr:sigma-70 family RNA polymerase sigma factor [Rubrivivax sp.]